MEEFTIETSDGEVLTFEHDFGHVLLAEVLLKIKDVSYDFAECVINTYGGKVV